MSLLRATLCIAAVCARAQSPADMVEHVMRQALQPGLIRSAVGITRQNTPIPALLTADDLDYGASKIRVLLIGGLDGSAASVESVFAAMQWFHTSYEGRRFHKQFALSAVPVANPDGWALGTRRNASGGDPSRGYPPQGDAYGSPENPEAAYLWRWIGMHAPDLVVDLRGSGPLGWQVPGAHLQLAVLRPVPEPPPTDSLVAQLARSAPSGTGTIPAAQYNVGASWQVRFFHDLLRTLRTTRFTGPSPARAEIQRRLRRTPLEVAQQLTARYGHELNEAVYIPAMALIGRLRLGELAHDSRHLADVERLAAPYTSGAKKSLERAGGSHLSGHLVFTELARLTGKPQYAELARAAANLGFDARGQPKQAMPFHNEMSDSIFMGCPILASVGRLTGEAKYFDMCLQHFNFMRALDLRPDGLYRHSPLDAAAWGRGNGFPALGLVLSIGEFPEDHAGRAELLRAFRAHMQALMPYQDPGGAWRQVIDRVESYRELTATCMIGFAMARGARLGWLEPAVFAPAVQRAWSAVKARVAPGGTLVDVCASTGKQKSLRDYLDRPATLGEDPRGGAMALLFATEMAVDPIAAPPMAARNSHQRW